MKVYWSRCGHGSGNFGDKLTPLLLRHHGIPCEWAPPEHAELIGVGSVLEKVPEDFRGIIWTTGFMREASQRAFPKARILALRGQLTRARVQVAGENHVPLGDAGLLCDVFAPAPNKRYQLGLIPHFADADDPQVKQMAASSHEISVIDICAETHEVIRRVSECQQILSSSLHGLILADSLGIPNQWIQFQGGVSRVEGEGYKFRDYYSIYGLTPRAVPAEPAAGLSKMLASIPPFERPGLDSIKQNLRATLEVIRAAAPTPSASEVAAKARARAEWHERLQQLQVTVARHIPAGSNVLIADGDELRFQLISLRTVPFLERGGTYWGPPGTDEEAIAELRRALDHGVQWFVIAWPMFWLLDRFAEFARYLTLHFETRVRDQTVVVLRILPQTRI